MISIALWWLFAVWVTDAMKRAMKQHDWQLSPDNTQYLITTSQTMKTTLQLTAQGGSTGIWYIWLFVQLEDEERHQTLFLFKL